MIVSIHQPAYLPWLGYFQRIAASDLHITLDHVQFEKNSFVNRNRIRTTDGWCWLTVPVRTRHRFGALPISEIEIDDASRWRAKHWNAIRQNYARAPYFDAHAGFFEDVYRRDWKRLADLCRAITDYLLAAFGIQTLIWQSTWLSPQRSKDELVLELCERAGADVYLSGALGRDYLRTAEFARAGIRVQYQDYQHPQYPQWRGDGFEPFMSAVDLLFNCGPNSRDILLSNQVPVPL